MNSPLNLSQKSRRTADQPISYFMRQAVENPDLISLAAGLVDAESLPAREVADAVAEILGNAATARAALQYGTTQGYLPLRELLLRRIVALDGKTPADMALTANDCVVTTGSQQLLYLVGEALLDPGDIVITAAPSYFVYQGTLHSMGARILSVPNDEDGMDTDALAELLTNLSRSGEIERLKLIYVVDYFDNPTGATLSLLRRRRLLELARQYSKDQRILILEDAAYRELRYDGDDLPSIKSLDSDNQFVILAMTFSKPLSPGLKTGYAFLPAELREPVLKLKGNHDFGSNNFTQFVLHQLLKTGAYDRHVSELRRIYRQKRDALLDALAAEFPAESGVTWRRPVGGLYVWLTLPSDIDTGPGGALIQEALNEGVLYVPGPFCYTSWEPGTPSVPRNETRLSFGVASIDRIGEAVRRLAAAVAKVAGGLKPSPTAAEQIVVPAIAESSQAVCCECR